MHLADPNQDAYLTAIGIKGVTTGDERAEAEAVIAYINAHGGAGGRRLSPVYTYYELAGEQKQRRWCDLDGI